MPDWAINLIVGIVCAILGYTTKTIEVKIKNNKEINIKQKNNGTGINIGEININEHNKSRK